MNQADARRQEILVLLRSVPELADAGELAVEPLTGVQSLNNASWVVTRPQGGGKEKYVLRVPEPGRAAALGIDRAEEEAAAKAAAVAGIGPEVVFFDSSTGNMLTRWFEGRAWESEDLREPENLRRTAEMLRTLHAITDVPGEPGAAYRRIRYLIHYARRLGLGTPAHLPEALHRLEDLEARLRESTGGRGGLNHNDLWANNILAGDARVRFVDWEFAGSGDGLYDLATVSMSGGFGPQEEVRLLAEYGLTGPQDHAAVQCVKWVVHFFEGAWSLIMHHITDGKESDFDYLGHATYMLEEIGREVGA
jgi:thiamine kinase-like enzyme